jgi:hypothetical protein
VGGWRLVENAYCSTVPTPDADGAASRTQPNEELILFITCFNPHFVAHHTENFYNHTLVKFCSQLIEGLHGGHVNKSEPSSYSDSEEREGIYGQISSV